MNRLDEILRRHGGQVRGVVFIAGLVPLLRLAYSAYADRLGANPIEAITHSTGTWTLAFLLITLAVTPLRRILDIHWLIKLRRMLGLYAFFYGCLHFTTYFWLDQFFDWEGIVKDVIKRPFITVGFLSFVLMIPLALTSTQAMVRQLGRYWQKLHWLIYAVATGGVLHFLWLVKKDITEPAIYGLVLIVLLGYRALRRFFNRVGNSGIYAAPALNKAD
ncbi:MAG: sulfite oxidase heme-binding subunit YedZ [Burkholderiales bacterium]